MTSALGRLGFFVVSLALIAANIAALLGGDSWLVLFGLSAVVTALQCVRDPHDAVGPVLFVGSLTLVLVGVWAFYGSLAHAPDPRRTDALLMGGVELATAGAIWVAGRFAAPEGRLMSLPFALREREGVYVIVFTPSLLPGWAVVLLENGWTGARRVEALVDGRCVAECVLGPREVGALTFEVRATRSFNAGVFAALRLRVSGLSGRRWAFRRGDIEGTTDPRQTTLDQVALQVAGNAATDLIEARDADLLHLTFEGRGGSTAQPPSGYERIEDVQAWVDQRGWLQAMKNV
jgi:hypothetical protein